MPSMTTKRAPGMTGASVRPLRDRSSGSVEPCKTTVGAVTAFAIGEQAAGAENGVEVAQHARGIVPRAVSSGNPIAKVLDGRQEVGSVDDRDVAHLEGEFRLAATHS